jgi:hypothetical protein
VKGKLLVGAALLATLLATLDTLDATEDTELEELEGATEEELDELDTGATDDATDEDDLLEDAGELETTDEELEATLAAVILNQLTLNPPVVVLILK